MKERRSTIAFMAVTVCLVLITAFCITGTVIGQRKLEGYEQDVLYRTQENCMVQEVRDYLDKGGYKNSGVMLTRVLEADGSREYTLTVHHGKIDALTDEGREKLQKELESFDFTAENCSFRHEFLITGGSGM